ncbi:MAG: hypothetical protein IJ647_11375 [Prevotella sp.]|nr:hypothetical protein [Prevotella sp.]
MGQETIIQSDILIERSDGKTFEDIFIGYMYVNGYVEGNTAIKTLTLSQCEMSSGTGSHFQAIVGDVFVDRCKLRINLSYNYEETITIDGETKKYKTLYVRKFTAVNSDITIYQSNSLQSYPPYNIINCVVYSDGAYGLTVITSMLNLNVYRTAEVKDFELINSIIVMTSAVDSKLTGCWGVGQYEVASNSTEEFLKENGYIGNDGTVVGPLGGSTPFTLVPTVPHVTEASLKVDPKKQELNATLTVSPN